MKEKIKILHVLGALDYGGAETMIMNFYRNINKDEFQFDFIVHTKEIGAYEKEIEKLGGKIYRVPRYKLYNHFSYKRAWNQFFKQHNKEYQIIHGHMGSTASIYLNIAKKYNVKTISHSHNTSNGRGFSAIVKFIFQRRIKYIADYFMGCSTEANIWLFGKEIAKNNKKCCILNNAIDYDKFNFSLVYREKIRNLYGLKDNDILLGHVGRFIEQKNHKFLIDVYASLLSKNKNYKLLLCGDGELKNKIIKYAKNKNVFENIIFVIPTGDIYKYYSAFDIFLFPSKSEGLGMVAIEAQVNGLPIILSNNIPKNVVISDKAKFIDITEENKEVWVNSILNTKINLESRKKSVLDIYDIKKEVIKLEGIYKKMVYK